MEKEFEQLYESIVDGDCEKAKRATEEILKKTME